MNTFEKHWRYYMQNPGQYEQLRLSNPAQYNSLNNYYRMCGEYLRLPPIPSAPTSSSVRPTDGQDNRQQRPESRASINLPQSSETPNTESAESRQQQQISALEQVRTHVCKGKKLLASKASLFVLEHHLHRSECRAAIPANFQRKRFPSDCRGGISRQTSKDDPAEICLPSPYRSLWASWILYKGRREKSSRRSDR